MLSNKRSHYAAKIDLIMKRLPHVLTPAALQWRSVHVYHFSLESRTWFGRVVAWIIGVALLIVTFFFSMLIFMIVASLVVVAFIYLLWKSAGAETRTYNQW